MMPSPELASQWHMPQQFPFWPPYPLFTQKQEESARVKNGKKVAQKLKQRASKFAEGFQRETRKLEEKISLKRHRKF